MREIPEKLRIYGGLNTGKKALNALAETVVRLGFVTPDADVKIFPLGEAGRKSATAADAAEGSLAVAHSMGNLIWIPINHRGVTPAEVIALNPPVPTKVPKLVLGGLKRVGHHLPRSFGGVHVAEHRQVLLDTVESVRDPRGNIGRILELGDYATGMYLTEMASRIPVVALTSKTDEFGPPFQKAEFDPPVHHVTDTNDCHDGVLYAPHRTLGLVASLNVLPQLH